MSARTFLLPFLAVIAALAMTTGCKGNASSGDSGVKAPPDASFDDAYSGYLEDVPPVAPPSRRPYVFQHDEVAPPGRYVSLCGRLLGNPPTVRLYRVAGGEPLMNERFATTVTTATASPACVQFAMPTAQPLGLYAVWVRNRDDLSSVYFLNRARPYYVEYSAAHPGARVRVFGLNLRLEGATPTVKLVSGNATLEAQVEVGASDENVLTFIVPNGIVNGTSYKVRVSNGFGGAFGEVDADVPLKGRPLGSGDPFALNVPWAGDFIYEVRATLTSGADVQAAIEEAAGVGGGVVRLQPGTYGGFALRSGVLVKGPEPGGDPATIEGSIDWDGASQTGLVDLVVNSTSPWGGAEVGQEKLVIRRVRSTHDHEGTVFALRGVEHVLVSEWTQNVGAAAGSPIDIGPMDGTRTEYVHMRGYRPTFIHFRLNVVNARYVTVENNVSTRDYALGYLGDHQHDSGHWNLELTHESAFLNSTVRAIGDVSIENDGEGWNTQGSSQHATYPPYFGNATGGTAATLEDRNTSFAFVNADNVEYWAFLVDGTGAGQVRRVAEVNGSALTVEPAWEVAPTESTRYIVQPLDAHRLLVRGCTMQDNSRNLWIYSGGYDVAIIGNRFRNGEVWLRAYEQEEGGSGASSGAQVYPVWKSYVAGNQLQTTTGDPIMDDGSEYHRSSHIMLTFCASEASGGDYSGMYLLVNSVVNNRVDAWPVDRFYDPPLTEGIHVHVNDESESSETRGRAGRDPDTDPIVGVVVQGNTVNGANTAYITGSGVRHIVIADRHGNATNVDNASDSRVGHGATLLVTD